MEAHGAARHVVVAAGAIETTRLLLASGIGTARDQVGRYLQGHIYAGAAGLFDEVVQDSVGPGPSIATTDYRHDNSGILGGGILVNEFVPTPVEAWLKLSGLRLVRGWSRSGADALREAYARACIVVGPVQEVPSRAARVTIEPRVKHRHRVPVVRLLSDGPQPENLRAAAFLSRRAEDWLAASAAGRVTPVFWAASRGPSNGQHQAGTCRMGASRGRP